MKKAYVIFPIVAMLIFFGIWWNYRSKYEAKQAAKQHQVELAKQQALKKQAADREKAIKEALAAQARRKAERAAKEAKQRADREARQLAIEARDKAYRDKEKLSRQLDRAKNDVAVEKTAIAKLQQQKKDALSAIAFLQKYVKMAQANQSGLHDVIMEIDRAEAAREAAAAAAAAAAKKKS